MSPTDLTADIGLVLVYLLTANILLGLLMGARYNTWKRWPHRRINVLKFHNWTGYVALALALAHPIPLLFVTKPRFGIGDILFPISSPEQPFINCLGALALYVLVFTVITSIYRAEIGRRVWKPLHYLTYVLAALFVVHGTFTDQNLDNKPIDFLDPEKFGIIVLGVVVIVASWFRVRAALRHPKFRARQA
jgi:predicted ferric reductase